MHSTALNLSLMCNSLLSTAQSGIISSVDLEENVEDHKHFDLTTIVGKVNMGEANNFKFDIYSPNILVCYFLPQSFKTCVISQPFMLTSFMLIKTLYRVTWN